VQKEFLEVAAEMLYNRVHDDQDAKELIWTMDGVTSCDTSNGDRPSRKTDRVSSETFRRQSLRDLLGLGVLDTEIPFDNELSAETALICYSSGTSVSGRNISPSRLAHDYTVF
jgi:hypothetical protein